MNESGAISVLDRLLDPITQCFTPDTARALIELKADAVAEARIDYLANRCDQGELTPEERSEYETYVHAGNLIGILQAKARLYLREHAA